MGNNLFKPAIDLFRDALSLIMYKIVVVKIY